MSLLELPNAFYFDECTSDPPTLSLPPPLATLSRLGRAMIRAAEAERIADDQRLKIAQLEAMLFTDDLTGLYNRRALLAELEREIEASTVVPASVGVCVAIDIDGIRGINERFGAAAGDAALRRVAQALCAAARPQDVVARIGGDEFAILLTQVDGDVGARLVARLAQRFEILNFQHEGHEIALAARLGWSGYGPGDQAGSVLAAADIAMARAARRPRRRAA
jgi:diguanylate cyclase (GGDEF)-like protein